MFVITFPCFSQILFISDLGGLSEALVLGKIQGFVVFFKMNPHEVLPDGGVGLGANGTVNRTR